MNRVYREELDVVIMAVSDSVSFVEGALDNAIQMEQEAENG